MKILRNLFLISILLFNTFAVNPEKRPNFIFILTDDLGWSCASSLMDDRYPDSKSDFFETPNIDRLADSGMRFTNGYAPAAICSPTRRSLQFGQTPIREGDETFPERYNPKTKQWLTIPLLLKNIDPKYKAAHYGKWDLRANIFPEDLGYDESDGDTGNRNGDVMSDKETKWKEVYLNEDPKRIESLTKRAINFMQRQVDAGNPFYLQVSHYATHVDMQTKEETYLKYLHKVKGKKHDNAGWAGMLENLDDGIGRIMDMVNKLGIADNTYIILMADNGGVEFIPPVKNKLDLPSTFDKPMRNAPLRGGKWVLYEGGIRVPFIVKGPGVSPHSYCNVSVSGCDILPTLSDLAGNKSPLPAYLDGGSIVPLFTNPKKGQVKRTHDAFYFHRYNRGYPHSAIIDGNYKLIKFWKTGKMELYDISSDIGEIHDLASQMPDKVQELDNKLMNYMKEVDAELLQKGGPGKTIKKKGDDSDE